MEIKRNGSRPSQRAPAEHFTGAVRLDPLFQPNGVQRAMGAYVSFEPCARKHRHGATPTTAMTHIAITEGVDWLEKVTDEQYSGTTKGERHAEA